MDWLQQIKTKNRIIFVLVFLNVLTMAMVWLQKSGSASSDDKPQGSVSLMKKELNLQDAQAELIEKSRTDKLGRIKILNDSASFLKKALANELFSAQPDSLKAADYARIIGELQSKIEMLRFLHFSELLAICTPEQKEKLKPIIAEVFTRKPPKPTTTDTNRKPDTDNKKPPKENPAEAGSPPPADNHAGNPPLFKEEKLEKYTRRLNLTEEQKNKVRQILILSEQKGQELRDRKNPDREVIEAEKLKIREEEDKNIFKILTPEQQDEFRKMQEKRKNK